MTSSSKESPVFAPHLNIAEPEQTLEEVLVQHEQYLNRYVELHNILLVNERALDEYEKAYVGLMAVCRHKSAVLHEELVAKFKLEGGPEDWLCGLEYASPKIKALHKINAILAHRPWMLDGSHLVEVIKAGMTYHQTVHALIILAYFHSMSSMLHALGIESATTTKAYTRYTKEGSKSSSTTPKKEKPKILKGLLDKMADILTDNYDPATGKLSGDSEDVISVDPRVPSIPKQGSLELHCDTLDTTEDDKHEQFSIYSPNLNFTYGDFYRRGCKSQGKTLRYDSLWHEICYSVILRYTSRDLADAMEKKFKTAHDMTYNTCGDTENVNTTHFRKAIWNYIQNLYGIRHDNYDYGHINHLLDRKLKLFLKMMSVAPDTLIQDQTNQSEVVKEFKKSEQVHIVIIAAEARLQVEILYAMFAMENYFVHHIS